MALVCRRFHPGLHCRTPQMLIHRVCSSAGAASLPPVFDHIAPADVPASHDADGQLRHLVPNRKGVTVKVPVNHARPMYDMRFVPLSYVQGLYRSRYVPYSTGEYVANTYSPAPRTVIKKAKEEAFRTMNRVNHYNRLEAKFSNEIWPESRKVIEQHLHFAKEVMWKQWFRFERGATVNELREVASITKYPELMDLNRRYGWMYSSPQYPVEKMRTVVPDPQNRPYFKVYESWRSNFEYYH